MNLIIKCLAGVFIVVAALAVLDSKYDLIETFAPPAFHVTWTRLNTAAPDTVGDYRFEVLVANDGARPFVVVGSDAGCGIDGCWDVKPLPVTVPPGESAAIAFTFTLRGSKPAITSHDVELYINDNMGQLITVPVVISLKE